VLGGLPPETEPRPAADCAPSTGMTRSGPSGQPPWRSWKSLLAS